MLLERQENFIPFSVKRNAKPKEYKLALLNACLAEEQERIGTQRKAKLSDIIQLGLYSRTTVYNWGQDINKPHIEAYFTLAKHYGWSKSYALELAEEDGVLSGG